MPELPEVETVRRSLAPLLLGRRVVEVAASGLPLRRPIVEADWRRAIVGGTFEALERRGKYLVARAGNGAAVLHLGMSGRLAVVPAVEPWAPHTHLSLALDDGRELRYIDPRRFGVAVAMPAAALASYAPLARLGVDPLDGDVVGVLAAVRRSRAAIRNLLLDQRLIAGLGNIYATEALFRARIHPACPPSRIAAARRARLAAAIRAVLLDAIDAGGTTLEDGGFVDATGDAGYFAVHLDVYGRTGLPCPRCGATIVRRLMGGRAASYCPRCQRY